jgi:hypothetical protein
VVSNHLCERGNSYKQQRGRRQRRDSGTEKGHVHHIISFDVGMIAKRHNVIRN